jgi:hypothetical protein
MPTVSRWLIRSAMVALLFGLGLMVAIAARSALGLPAWVATLGPAALHLITVGWLTQMVFGVAFWMFPRFSAESPRGSEKLAWTSFVTLNVGLALRVAGEPLAAIGRGVPGLLVASAVLQVLAALAFTANTWPRLRAKV